MDKLFIEHQIVSTILESIEYLFVSRVLWYQDQFILFVTSNDKVYGCGNNKLGQLGLGHDQDVVNFQLIHELCNQNITNFYQGNNRMFATTNSGEIFFWGANYQAILGCERKYPVKFLNPTQNVYLTDIVYICCGNFHTLALTSDKQLYGWGNNHEGQLGLGENKNLIIKPEKIIFDDKTARITFISCYGNTSFAVTDKGRAYFWGESYWKQNEDFIYKPRSIVFETLTKPIKEVLGTEDWLNIISDNKIIRVSTKDPELIYPQNGNEPCSIECAVLDDTGVQEYLICQMKENEKSILVKLFDKQMTELKNFLTIDEYFIKENQVTFSTLTKQKLLNTEIFNDCVNYEMLKIIDTNPENNQLLLKYNELLEWMTMVKDMEVAVIAVIGPKQTGKSFLLNYIWHFLSQKTNEEQIKGFESRDDDIPVTNGLWLSRPIIVKRPNGTDMAVLLMDTQAVFDGNVEEYQKILWITLLISSCLMINVLSNLNEEYLERLEPFLQFMSSATDSSNTSCAQSLIFLIRDWNRANLFKHGHNGGQQYLSNRLEIKEGSRAINTKRLIKNCFNEVYCYLFPGLGLTDEDQDFDGFMKTLSPVFIGCLQEMLAQRMGSNNLMPKEINNKCINGSDLCLYFKVYINLFNGNELPNHLEINFATNETFDLILINKIKDQHSIQLKSFISRNNSFVSRKDLKQYYRVICEEFKKDFKLQIISKIQDIVDRLNDILKQNFKNNFKTAFNQNERNRKQCMKSVLKNCEIILNNCLKVDFEYCNYFEQDEFERIFAEHRETVLNQYKKYFNFEENQVFELENEQFENICKQTKNKWKAINKKCITEDLGFSKNTRAIDEAIYNYKMKMTLNPQIFNYNERASSIKSPISDAIPENMETTLKYYHQLVHNFSNNYSAFFVMNDNKVYCFGSNETGKLGLGHNRSVDKYTLIEELCKQNIEEFFEGTFCIFARTNNNQILSWGWNNTGQLARGYKSDLKEYLKPKSIEFFENKNIIDITCDSYHCLGLSADGVVYGWGNNYYGQVGSNHLTWDEFVPIRIEFNNNNNENRIKFIHCYEYTSCAVTVDGTAYLWGKVNERKTLNPIKIETNVTKIYSNSDKMFSILTTTRMFKLFENDQCIFETDQVENIFTSSNHIVFRKEDSVYEINESNQGQKTEFLNFYEYFLYKHNKCIETIHITSDGYLMRHTIECNYPSDKTSNNELGANSEDVKHILRKVYENIFELKFENCFDVIKMIGSFGSGTVLVVRNKSNQELFAVKRIQISGEKTDERVDESVTKTNSDNFMYTLRDIKLMSELSSNYVVKYINSWTESKVIDKQMVDFVYIQMELCSQNLKTLIQSINTHFDDKFKTIQYFIRSQLLVEIIECLNYLHSSKPPIIHRDLKPQNILVTDGTNGRFLKLCDFGLSKVLENSLNTRGVGTIEYMAPEVSSFEDYDPVNDKSRYNLKADIYSLGVIATKLFDLKISIKKLRKLEDIEFLLDFSNGYLNEKFKKLLNLISLMLSKRPEERPNCSELLDKTHEWTLDSNTFIDNEYYNQFIQKSETDEKLSFLKTFLETKLLFLKIENNLDKKFISLDQDVKLKLINKFIDIQLNQKSLTTK